MSNPTFRSGPITFDVEADVKKFRLVTVGEKGIKHAAATGQVFGAVTESGRADADGHVGMSLVKAPRLAVHIGPASVPLEVDGGDASAIKQGAAIYAAADGKVAATGTVLVGVATRDGAGERVITTLITPVVGA